MRPVLFTAIILVFCLAGLEALVRTVRPMPPLLTMRDIGWNATGSPYRTSPRADPHFVHHMDQELNQLSLRGRPFTHDSTRRVKILLVGDSQIESATVPFGDIPEIRLEKLLDTTFDSTFFEVRSIAASGWGQDQQLLALREYYKTFQADYLFVWHTPRNDFWENGFPDRSTDAPDPFSARLKPTFFLNDRGLAQLDFTAYAHSSSPLNRLHLYRLPFRVLERFGLDGRARLFHEWETLIPSPEGHVKVPRRACPAPIVEEEAYTRERGQYGFNPVSIESAEAFRDSRSNFSPFLDPPSKRDRYLLQVTEALFREMAALARSHDTEFAVFFNHQTYKDADSDSARVGSCVGRADEWYRVGDMAAIVRGTLKAFNLIELSSRHPDVSLDEVSVSKTDRHLNRLGNELLLRELVLQLKMRGWTPYSHHRP